MRINKFIASCGVASRRAAEKIITEGRVKLNNKKVVDLATDVDIFNDTITIDNNIIKMQSRNVYIMLNKPKGCLSTVSDDRGRKTIMDYLGDIKDDLRLFPIGRLDYDTEGLLLITNDGEMSQKLIHPSNEIDKTYIVKIEGEVEEKELDKIRKGIMLDRRMLSKSRIKFIKYDGKLSRLEVIIHEGKNRQIHRMFESINKNVVFLKRVAIGDLRLGGLSRGSYRYLTEKEISYLKSLDK
ncbi:MAG: pseudouridine synthase [Bacillota bacterium]